MSRRSRPQSISVPKRLGILESADYLGVDECTVRRWIRNGTLRANRVGPKLVRIDVAELDKLIQPIGGNAS